MTLDRRKFLAVAGSALLAGCSTREQQQVSVVLDPAQDPYYLKMYSAMPNERFPIPAVNLKKVDPRYYRQVVHYPTQERPGTLIVDTANRFLYLTMENNQAMRYGVGIGRAGFSWGGRAKIAYKREWPTWTPPAEMIERQPELEKYRNGMQPGIDNPLGARALYIFENGRDTLYRVHGTAEYWTIGTAVSSGCVRLMNQDIIDLYNRVPNGSPIIVYQDGAPAA